MKPERKKRFERGFMPYWDWKVGVHGFGESEIGNDILFRKKDSWYWLLSQKDSHIGIIENLEIHNIRNFFEIKEDS